MNRAQTEIFDTMADKIATVQETYLQQGISSRSKAEAMLEHLRMTESVEAILSLYGYTYDQYMEELERRLAVNHPEWKIRSL